MKKQTNKYRNVKTRGYDSNKEAERARVLHLLEKAGKISNLREQVVYKLVPAVYEFPDGTFKPEWATLMQAQRISTLPDRKTPAQLRKMGGKRVENGVKYVADFVYHDEMGRLIVEDAKGVRTPDYIIKRKLMLWTYGIKIKEV